MKKFLSLVLALVMAMSLVTISAGAKEFKDLASSDYQEAIDLISDLGIVGGVTADTFQPKGTLTRGAATKFVANLMLGPDLAAKLPDGAPFTDVPAGSTFAKYASYLKSQGVVGGYGNGSFGVKNGLTGDAFLKMVLGALGYDAAIEGYGVDGWQVNVALDAIGAGLVDGLKDFDSSKVITREQAAQIVLNALEANTVKYTNKSTISIGNVVINNNSEAEDVTGTATKEYTGGSDDGKVQLIEKLFPGVYKNESDKDNFGRPAVAWYDNTLTTADKQITLTVEQPVKVYSTKQSGKTIATLLGLKDTDDLDYKRYVNGTGVAVAQINVTSTSTSSNTVGGASGSTTEIYYNKDLDVPTTVIQINEYIGKVTDVIKADDSDDDKRHITITPLDPETASKRPASAKTEYDFITEDFEEDDIVVYTYSSIAGEVQSVELAPAKTGEYTKLESTATIHVGGAKFSPADTASPVFNATVAAAQDVEFGDSLKVYLNSNGFYLYVEEVEKSTTQDKYAYVLAGTVIEGEADWATGKAAADTYKAQLLFTDGTTAIVETNANYGYYADAAKTQVNAGDLTNNFVKYGVDEDGLYVLTDITEGDTDAANAILTKNNSVAATINGASVTVSKATTYIVKTLNDKDEAVYTVYVGYKAAPALEGNGLSDVIKNTSGVATYVFIDASDDTAVEFKNNTAKDIVIFRKPSTKYTDKNGVYYTATVMINGAKKTVEITGDAFSKADKDFEIFTSYTINENGRYELPTAVTPDVEAGVGINYVDGVLTVASVNYALAEDVVIVYSSSATSLVEWTEADLVKDTNDQVYLYLDTETDEVEYLLIVKK